MTLNDRQYHLQREQHCLDMAGHALDPEVRRRHEELAQYHAGQAAEQAQPASA